MLANADHPPPMPLEQWPVGQPVQDVQVLALPPGAPEIQVLLGFWHDDQRLPVDQPAAQDGQQRMRGPVIGGGGPPVPEAHVQPDVRPAEDRRRPLRPGLGDAAPVDLVGSLDGRRPQLRTTARLLYDDQALYVSFDCEDPNIWGTLFKRDEPSTGRRRWRSSSTRTATGGRTTSWRCPPTTPSSTPTSPSGAPGWTSPGTRGCGRR